jgi:alpha-tubulin suppressor-like RCC1 family protein
MNRMTYPSDFNIRALSLMATTLIALAAPPPARADTDALPQTIGGEKVVEIATGNHHSCARVESGRVWCWGENEFGQLGDGTVTNRLTAVRVAN